MPDNKLLLKNLGLSNFSEDNTSGEIAGQPALWLKTWDIIKTMRLEISKFFSEAGKLPGLQVILTGAGTSAFIGDALAGYFQKETGFDSKAVATTDLVTHPEFYFQKNRNVLLVSFARSGDSPESTAAVELAEQLTRKVFNLVITCNEKGKLTDAVKGTNHLIIKLPQEANDKSLAMTGSFTSMLLVGILISDINSVDKKEKEILLLKSYGEKIFEDYLQSIKKASELNFDRAVFLGSGMLRGIARESQLKLQELTDGNIICKYDSFLGFRHGPKAVINENTLLTFLYTNNTYVNKYEVDLVKAVSRGRKPKYIIGVTENKINGIKHDLEIILGNGKSKLSEELFAVTAVLPAQILGYFKSYRLGLKPDNPSESGMIHRVVKGVNIYPYGKAPINDSQ